jgi:hypothetical protein
MTDHEPGIALLLRCWLACFELVDLLFVFETATTDDVNWLYER